MTVEEKKDDSIKKVPEEESGETKSDVDLKDKGGDEEVIEEKVEEKSKVDSDTVPRNEYERLLKDKKDLEILYGRQTNELGQMRRQVPSKVEQEKKLSPEEKLNLLATNPDKYEDYLIAKAEKRALQKFQSYQQVHEVERELVTSYPDLRDENSEMFRMTRRVMAENPTLYQQPAALKLAAEVASNRLRKPEDLIAKGREEAKKNIRIKSRETAMETSKASDSGVSKSKSEELLGRSMTDREKKFLDRLGVTIDDLTNEATYETVTKGGKK